MAIQTVAAAPSAGLNGQGRAIVALSERYVKCKSNREYSADLSVNFQFRTRWYQACSKRPLCNSLKPANMAWPWLRVQPRPGRCKRWCTTVLAALSTVPLPMG